MPQWGGGGHFPVYSKSFPGSLPTGLLHSRQDHSPSPERGCCEQQTQHPHFGYPLSPDCVGVAGWAALHCPDLVLTARWEVREAHPVPPPALGRDTFHAAPGWPGTLPATPTVQNVLINPSLIGPKNILITTNMVLPGAADPNPLKRKHEDDDNYDGL